MQTARPRLPSRTLVEWASVPRTQTTCPDRSPRLLSLALRQLCRGEPASRCSALSSRGLWPPEPVTPPVGTPDGVPTSPVRGRGARAEQPPSAWEPLRRDAAESFPSTRERNVGVEPRRRTISLSPREASGWLGPGLPSCQEGLEATREGRRVGGLGSRPGALRSAPPSVSLREGTRGTWGAAPGNGRACLCSLGGFASWFGLSWLVCTPGATAECEAGWVSGTESPLVFPSSRSEASGQPGNRGLTLEKRNRQA